MKTEMAPVRTSIVTGTMATKGILIYLLHSLIKGGNEVPYSKLFFSHLENR